MLIQQKWLYNIHKLMEHNESSVKRKVHSTKYLQKESGKTPREQVNRTPESSRIKRSRLTQED